MRVRGFLYKNGSCLSSNDGLSFQADRVEGVMLTDDMTLAQLKESIRGRLRMGRGEEICNVTYRMPMTLCPLRFGELNLCDDYSVAMMFENFRDNATNLNGVELLVQTVSSSIVEFDLNVSPVIDEGGSATVVACTQALVNFTIEATNIDSAIIEFPSSNVCRRGSSSRRNPAVGESSRQRTAYVNEDEAEMRDPDFVSSDIPDTSSEGDLEASGDDTSDDNGIDEGSDDDGTDGGGGHDYDDDDHVGEVGGGDGLPDERLAPFYDQIDMEAQAGPEFPEDVPPTMDNPLFLGAMFDNKDAFRQAVKMYSIRQHRDYTVFKSKATFVDYRCKWYNNPCPWRMRARERDYYWEITRYVGPHTCVTPTLTQDNPKMDSTFIASCIVPDVIMTPSIRVSAIIDRIRVMFNTTVKYKKAWRAKHKALGRAFGNWDRSYAIMPLWLEAARHFNPGSVVVWEHMPHPENTDEFCFYRVFWTFAPCIAAFAHLKPILQIDGTFLYEKYTGTLLLAVGQDGNKKVVPLAFAIVEKESESSWHWFLTLLRRHLVKDRTDICLISDRHPGILNAVNDETLMWHPPYAENVYCVRHLTSNLNKAYKNAKLKKLFVRTARTTQKHRTMREAHRGQFNPVGIEENWPDYEGPNLMPNPDNRRRRGRPRTRRRQMEMDRREPAEREPPMQRRCGLCRQTGHRRGASIIMAARRQHINPGPENMSLLTQQQNHISERIWNGDDSRELRSRRSCAVDDGLPPPCIVPYLIQAGFYGVSRVGHFEYVRPLIRALVERWHPETHTFHFPQGECTITLQDVALQLGLPCSGYVVTGTEKHNYHELCMELLGIELPQQRQTRKGQRVSMSWLKSQFQYVPDHNSPEVYKQRYTRQYILHLLGGYLIPDKTSTDCCLMYLPLLRDFAECGQYSWGSAVLGTLYRELCKAANPETEEIAGCLSLLHVWAWDRFPKLAPPRPPPRDPLAHIYQPLPPLAARWQGMLTTARPATSSHHMYRQMIDRMDECGDRGEIPNEYLQHPDIWRASVPLVNFAIVEWHHSDRVLRQFGMTQSIPGPPRDLSDVHGLSLRNKSHQTWYERHKAWIDIWFQWPALVCTTSVAPTHLDRRSDYMQWYRRHTRRWIHPDSAAQGYAGDVADRTMSQVHEQGASHHPFARDVGMGLTDLMQFNTPLANPYVPSPPEPSRGPHFCEGGPSNAFQGLCTPRELFGDASQCQSSSFGTLYSDPLVHQQPPPMDFMSTFDPDVSSLWSDVMGPDVNVGQHSPHVAHTGLTFDLNQTPSEEPDQQPESQQFGDSQPCHNQSEDEDPAVPRRTGRRRAPTRCGTGRPDGSATRPLPSCPYVDGREGVLGSPRSSSGQCPACSGFGVKDTESMLQSFQRVLQTYLHFMLESKRRGHRGQLFPAVNQVRPAFHSALPPCFHL
ncbi:serine/threonine-protein phosphatase 7 long form-like protein [Senna tora]|uniref:Serine/threonine-protein phosphatase 7 long form-like protein n=1 Tax=Senna tora TaxID=362788 RepID=A0A834T5S3_9FABA|nr:serine/threonine-protein phosphatase 7 long form-like protein [Senna tora]